MQNLGFFDYIFLYSIICIWLMLLMNIVLSLFGYIYYTKILKLEKSTNLHKYPFVSVLIPAHNEGKVIYRTVQSILALNYPHDKLEVIIINDNSSDDTGKVLEGIKNEHMERNITIITTDKETGGKGKSNALNIGFRQCRGEYIAVYDADNTPDRNALIYLVKELNENEVLGAVIGKFRTRNKDRNLLTKFINIETLSFQWMAQAGRWQFMKSCTIPGTNFVIKRDVLIEVGGWDINAIAEDTELSFRVYMKGYKIKYLPISVTHEQEPETLRVWFKQRTRWAKGNIYVLVKNIKYLFKSEGRSIRFDIIYFSSVYFLFMSSVVLSDLIFILHSLGVIEIRLGGNIIVLWFMAYVLFILEIGITLATEKGESTLVNILIIAIMYFTYCQMWLAVAINGLYQQIKSSILGHENKWYKTDRF